MQKSLRPHSDLIKYYDENATFIFISMVGKVSIGADHSVLQKKTKRTNGKLKQSQQLENHNLMSCCGGQLIDQLDRVELSKEGVQRLNLHLQMGRYPCAAAQNWS